VRKPRRYCPGVSGDICSICCGTERENTVRCPFDCVYLREARLHERTGEGFDINNPPHPDIRIRDEFLAEKAEQIDVIASILARAALMEPGAVDNDVRDALEALVRTYRTLQSGLYYDTRPENATAARVCDNFQTGIEAFRREAQQEGASAPTDSEMLTMIAFLQRVEMDRNNGRGLGRAFLDFLRTRTGADAEGPATPSLILPA